MSCEWGYGSVGRAIRSQRIGQGFESPYLHQIKIIRTTNGSDLFCIYDKGNMSVIPRFLYLGRNFTRLIFDLLKIGNKKSVPCKQNTPRNVPHLLSHKTILNMGK